MKTILNDFSNLFYPRICTICKSSLLGFEADVCTICFYKIPKTTFVSFIDNPVARLFWGRINICYASAYYYYCKGGLVQRLIHEIKYSGKPHIGYKIGSMYGNELVVNKKMGRIDYVVPVPLHSEKENKRGYNQCLGFAKGLAIPLGAKVDGSNLVRTKNSSTQTNKSRIDRWQNVSNVFEVRKKEVFKNKHILIVDDVITSGSTLEACASTMIDVDGIQISVLGIAFAV